MESGWDQVVLSHIAKNPDRINDQGFLKGAWRCPTLTWGDPTLPSAISHFTAEFGMGSGGSNFLWSPGLSG